MADKPIILIVDDIPSNVQVLAGILKDDYTIKFATNGLRALELSAIEPKPDLILLDVMIPDMDGYEVCAKLKNDNNTKNIPVIFVTANGETVDEEMGFEMGGVDYITKPVNQAIVKARVKTQITIKKQYDELKSIAMHDKLTGLYNRHYLIDVADRKILSAHRHNTALCMIMLDIDHFKKVNDTYGHLTGDEVLKAIAKVLKFSTRAEDFVSRYGGEEFIIIFEGCDIKDGLLRVEKIREEIESLNPQNIKVTASFGISELSENHKNFDMLLKDADEALYIAKDNGRNQVVIK